MREGGLHGAAAGKNALKPIQIEGEGGEEWKKLIGWSLWGGGGMKAENIHTGGGWEKWTTGLTKMLGGHGKLTIHWNTQCSELSVLSFPFSQKYYTYQKFNLFYAIPYIGGDLVNWIWGGFGVDNPFPLSFLGKFLLQQNSSKLPSKLLVWQTTYTTKCMHMPGSKFVSTRLELLFPVGQVAGRAITRCVHGHTSKPIISMIGYRYSVCWYTWLGVPDIHVSSVHKEVFTYLSLTIITWPTRVTRLRMFPIGSNWKTRGCMCSLPLRRSMKLNACILFLAHMVYL
jgi:hypothetical protein